MNKFGPLSYALYLLKLRDRSIGEIRDKMRKKEFAADEIEKIILFLTEKNFLDDERFAKNFVKNQLSIKPAGKYILSQKLKQKFINKDIIDKTLSEIRESEECDLALEAAEKKYKVLSIRHQEEARVKEKLMRYLASRGFGYAIIKKVTQKLLNC